MFLVNTRIDGGPSGLLYSLLATSLVLGSTFAAFGALQQWRDVTLSTKSMVCARVCVRTLRSIVERGDRRRHEEQPHVKRPLLGQLSW